LLQILSVQLSVISFRKRTLLRYFGSHARPRTTARENKPDYLGGVLSTGYFFSKFDYTCDRTKAVCRRAGGSWERWGFCTGIQTPSSHLSPASRNTNITPLLWRCVLLHVTQCGRSTHIVGKDNVVIF